MLVEVDLTESDTAASPIFKCLFLWSFNSGGIWRLFSQRCSPLIRLGQRSLSYYGHFDLLIAANAPGFWEERSGIRLQKSFLILQG